MNLHQREIYDFIESQYIPDFEVNGSATVKDLLNKAKLINRKFHLGKYMLDYQIELMEKFLTKDIL